MKVSYEILVDVFLFSSNFGLICGKMKIPIVNILEWCSWPDLWAKYGKICDNAKM